MVQILTNFVDSPELITLPSGQQAQVHSARLLREFRKRLPAADVIVVNCGDSLLYKLAAYFLLLPWKKRPIVAVDIVLRKPLRFRDRISATLKRLLLSRVDHFIHYFRDIEGYTKYFGIQVSRSSYVPFKVNSWGSTLPPADLPEPYVLAMGL